MLRCFLSRKEDGRMGSCVSNEEDGATTVEHLRTAPPPHEDVPQLDGSAMLHIEGSTPFPHDDDHSMAGRDVSPPHSWKVSERRRSSNNSMIQARRRSSQTASPSARLSTEKRTSLLSSSRKSVTTFRSTVDGVWSSSHCMTNRSSIGSSMEAGDLLQDDETQVDPCTVVAEAPTNRTEEHNDEEQHASPSRLRTIHRTSGISGGTVALAASTRRRSLNTNVLVPLSQIGSDPSSSASDEEGVAVVERIEDLTF